MQKELWNQTCKYAPIKFAKHCKKENQGIKAIRKAERRGKTVNKGYYGCAKKCRFYEAKK